MLDGMYGPLLYRGGTTAPQKKCIHVFHEMEKNTFGVDDTPSFQAMRMERFSTVSSYCYGYDSCVVRIVLRAMTVFFFLFVCFLLLK